MEDLYRRIAEQKRRLDALRPLAPELLATLRHHYDVELTYTSNAIEGNTLTLRETAEVIEHGITVGGKKLKDYLEAQDHYAAVQWMREQADASTPLSESTITELHRQVVLRSNPDIAGSYSPYPRRIQGSAVVFPNPMKVPSLMEEFGQDLASLPTTPEAAFEAHFRLTAIHPFADGNGRTARLLMNLSLIRGGYPPVAVRPKEREDYLEALETASVKEDKAPFQRLMHERLDATLADYVAQFEQSVPVQEHNQRQQAEHHRRRNEGRDV